MGDDVRAGCAAPGDVTAPAWPVDFAPRDDVPADDAALASREGVRLDGDVPVVSTAALASARHVRADCVVLVGEFASAPAESIRADCATPGGVSAVVPVSPDDVGLDGAPSGDARSIAGCPLPDDEGPLSAAVSASRAPPVLSGVSASARAVRA
ncbi:MAG: hypothetical protein AB1938_22810 [Myxococcota bacterium]